MSPVAASLTSPNPLFARNIITDAGSTLSSWGSCMAVAYCKWPVIVAIIIGGLIVLSVVLCCARFFCCGLECCCALCSCCNACCPKQKNRKTEQPRPPPQTYGPQPGMAYGPQFYGGGAPQYATFDASTGAPKLTEDSLPAMPSWQHAQTRKVEVEESEPSKDSDLNEHDHQLYEDPDESERPMLSSDNPNTLYDQEHQQYSPDHAYPYQDHGSYAPNDTSYSQQHPSHAYSQYNQQQDAYGNAPVTPSSAYASNYPPTNYSQQSANRSFSRPLGPGYGSPPPVSSSSPPPMQGQHYQPISPLGGATGPTGYRGATYSPQPSPRFSPPPNPSQGYNPPVEAPASQAPVEMPGSLMPGGGQRYYSQQQQGPHELGAAPPRSAGGSRYPSNNNWQ